MWKIFCNLQVEILGEISRGKIGNFLDKTAALCTKCGQSAVTSAAFMHHLRSGCRDYIRGVTGIACPGSDGNSAELEGPAHCLGLLVYLCCSRLEQRA
jgi:hypothetical protein